MLVIKTLTVKNFMSVGNQTQALDLNRDDLTLVLGENLDLGGDDTGARNGTGKTTIINALSYALFGSALTNIKKDNLINKTNGKHMLTTCDFEVDGVSYKIERGRKPNILKFYVDGKEQEPDDESQGDSRKTQQAIESLLGLSHDMFKHILALNTYSEPFLSMRANDQRNIIEQLLGITLLSEKADRLKKQINGDKQTGKYGTKDLIQEEEFRIKAIQDSNKKITDTINNLKRRQKLWYNKKADDIKALKVALEKLNEIDINEELERHKQQDVYKAYTDVVNDLTRERNSSKRSMDDALHSWNVAKSRMKDLENKICYACGQEIKEDHEDLINQYNEELKKSEELYNEAQAEYEKASLSLEKEQNKNVLKPENTFYDDIGNAYEHANSIKNLEEQIKNKEAEEDPYEEQIDELENEAIQEISYDKLNELTRIKDHQEFLLKLLTNKDSYIRKRIIDQNLAFLNNRLSYYLQKIGLPHDVEFRNDLSVEISELGRDLDFDNLSRGERNRLILSLSWAFRDVWENLYNPINLLFIDELIDSGMDSTGVENSLSILKSISRDRKKSVWLVSHKDELIGRVHNVLKVIKENGFTSYNNDVDII